MSQNTVTIAVRMTQALTAKLDAAVQAEREIDILGLPSRSSITRKALAGYLEHVEIAARATVAKPQP